MSVKIIRVTIDWFDNTMQVQWSDGEIYTYPKLIGGIDRVKRLLNLPHADKMKDYCYGVFPNAPYGMPERYEEWRL